MSLLRLVPIVSLALAACSVPGGPPMHEIAPELNSTLGVDAETVVVPGDVLSVRTIALAAIEQVDFEVRVPVQPDGRVVLPGTGPVHVAGRTPGQLTELMQTALAEDVATGTKIAVSIAEPAERVVHVLGSVKSTGLVPVPADGHLTLPEAFAATGGVAWLGSNLANTMIVRWDAENQRQISWVVDARWKWWGAEQTILLQPNDVVFVPMTPVARVNTWIDRYIIRNIPFPRFIIPG